MAVFGTSKRQSRSGRFGLGERPEAEASKGLKPQFNNIPVKNLSCPTKKNELYIFSRKKHTNLQNKYNKFTATKKPIFRIRKKEVGVEASFCLEERGVQVGGAIFQPRV